MAGNYVRDKDGALASMLLCELAAKLKAAGQTLHEKLDSLFWQHGVHVERTINVQMPGSEGMTRMKEVMAAFRSQPPAELGGDPRRADSRLRVANGHTRRRQTAAARRPEGRPGDSRPGDRGQLRRLPPQRHRAEDQVLHVRLHAARAASKPRDGEERSSKSGSSRDGSRPAEVRRAYNSTPTSFGPRREVESSVRRTIPDQSPDADDESAQDSGPVFRSGAREGAEQVSRRARRLPVSGPGRPRDLRRQGQEPSRPRRQLLPAGRRRRPAHGATGARSVRHRFRRGRERSRCAARWKPG